MKITINGSSCEAEAEERNDKTSQVLFPIPLDRREGWDRRRFISGASAALAALALSSRRATAQAIQKLTESPTEDGNGLPIRLYVREVSLTVLGKQAKVLAIEQNSGVRSFEPQTSSGFNVEVINQLKEPTSIHWHGLVLPALMDGVPFVSQEPIPPNGKFHYQFPLKQSGTYWMHSHFGLQEQSLGTAPLILWTEEQQAKADEQYVVLLHDFSFKPVSQILKELKAGMKR
jgi:FtsP/CotA-like multicopper oxidase with cupredoxin domain